MQALRDECARSRSASPTADVSQCSLLDQDHTASAPPILTRIFDDTVESIKNVVRRHASAPVTFLTSSISRRGDGFEYSQVDSTDPNATGTDTNHVAPDQRELEVPPATHFLPQTPENQEHPTSSGGHGERYPCDQSRPGRTRSCSGRNSPNRNIPQLCPSRSPHDAAGSVLECAVPHDPAGSVLECAVPTYPSAGKHSWRRLHLLVLLALLIAGGVWFAWQHYTAINIDDTRAVIRQYPINQSDFFSPDANSSEYLAINDTSVSPAHNASGTAATRNSCNFYSCSSCTNEVPCGWCKPSGKCSVGTEFTTSDPRCVGGYPVTHWVWRSSDCSSRCAAGSYSSSGNVRRPL